VREIPWWLEPLGSPRLAVEPPLEGLCLSFEVVTGSKEEGTACGSGASHSFKVSTTTGGARVALGFVIEDACLIPDVDASIGGVKERGRPAALVFSQA
jgi:hypothetical protein